MWMNIQLLCKLFDLGSSWHNDGELLRTKQPVHVVPYLANDYIYLQGLVNNELSINISFNYNFIGQLVHVAMTKTQTV